MTVVLIIVGYLVITLISNALTNLVIFNDEFELDTDATSVLLASLLWELMIPLCLLILFTRLVKLVIDKISSKISNKILTYRIHKIQMKNYKAVVEEDKTSETKEA
jgi:hypothetical protein